jgi:hypothetical protein
LSIELIDPRGPQDPKGPLLGLSKIVKAIC